MRITESRLRRMIHQVILESTGGKKSLAKAYGCEVFGQSISFDAFTLEVVLESNFNVSYAKQAIERQEGKVISETDLSLVAEFPFMPSSSGGMPQNPSLVAENIAFYIARG